MIVKLAGETWKSLIFQGWQELRNRYALSDAGRIASYKKNVLDDGKLLSGSLTTGYRTLNLHHNRGKSTLYIHCELIKLFRKKNSMKHKYVIHLNHNKLDNRIKNLRWATFDQMLSHQQKSPAKIAYKEKQASRTAGFKLTAAQVKIIKEVLKSKSSEITIKKLAQKFAVSETTIYRIRSRENRAGV